MRKYEKKQCADLIKTLEEAHTEITKLIEKKNIDGASELLEQCQQAAIAIGEIIERSEGEGTEAVRKLEDYCEKIYGINQDIIDEKELSTRHIEKNLQKQIISAQNSINALPTRIEAVFLPYKASMWDSLESIWIAADADPDCDAYVIPIPYFDKKPDGSFAKMNYEADLYPDYVPVIDYNGYKFEEHHPDIIFIHNPYDEYNYVTTVHPYFYSKNLRTLTDCLVYVPYYATAGSMSEGQRICSAYAYADYIVVQSKDLIEQFDSQIPREKFIPLGSPKFDRVIRLCNDPPRPPAGWQEKMEGKRVYFYNTSLNGLLDDTASFLKKMEYVFDTFRDVEDVCLLWRPHPLFETTLDAMRSEYKQEYERIKHRFIDEDIGIFDTTTDIEATISHCDAYIGDGGTSVISLFEAAGKAVFLLDNRVTEKPGKDAWKGIYTVYPADDMRYNRAIVMPDDKLFWTPDNDLKYEFFCDLPKDKFHWGYIQAFSFGGNIYVFPRNAQEILVISEKSREIKHIPLEHEDGIRCAFDRVLIFGQEYAFLIPNKYPSIVRFNFSNNELVYINGIRDYLWTEEQGEPVLCACGFSGRYRKLLLTSRGGNTLLSICMDTLEIESIDTAFGQTMVSLLSEDWARDKYFWFLPYTGTKVVRWDLETNTYKEHELNIDGLLSYSTQQHRRSNEFFFSSYAVWNDSVIFAPRWGNKFVKLDMVSGKTEEWVPPFPIYMENIAPHYVTWDRGWFAWTMDGHVWAYANSPERITYKMNFDANTAVPLETCIEQEDIYEQYCKGFSAESRIRPVCCSESPWNTLHDIATDHISGNKFRSEDQKAAFLRINASGDGRCGENIYRYLKQAASR